MTQSEPRTYRVAGLFAGIGGVELGLSRAGHEATLLCEVWEPAKAVLGDRFPGVDVHPDVRSIDDLGGADVITAGFPCTDLSQAGRMAGIGGEQSGLVSHVFRLLDSHEPTWLCLENVRNMLPLDGGRAMHFLVAQLEERGYTWAYRLVDSRFTGVPQRRQRVILAASRTEDPRDVLLVDDAGDPGPDHYDPRMFGFYWTEGLRGLGWGPDCVPTLKGGSTIGIASPPGVWIPDNEVGAQIVSPSIGDAEAMQGFDRGWTSAVQGRKGLRWKLVGNAVSVGVSEWLGQRLAQPGTYVETEATELAPADKWPTAAWGGEGRRFKSHVSLWPEQRPYTHLHELLDLDAVEPLSYRAAAGFLERTSRSTLRFNEEFLLAVKRHVEHVSALARP